MSHSDHALIWPVLAPIDHAPLAMRIAARSVVADIESESIPVDLPGGLQWLDVRPMLREQEHGAVGVAMFGEALSYAFDAGLIAQHPTVAHLVRIVRTPD